MSENSIESVLSMISSNPDLINKISSAVQAGGDDLSKNLSSVISLISESQIQSNKADEKSALPAEEKEAKIDTPADKIGNSAEFLLDEKANSFLSTLSKSISKNSSLLIALKPYLSKNRCEIIDTVIKISQLSNIMNLVK